MGLIGWWPLHENSGRANDLSGNGNHGTVSGATQGASGIGSLKSYYFNGSSDYIGIPALPHLTSYTISFWTYHVKGSNQDDILDLFGNNRIYTRDKNNGDFELGHWDTSSTNNTVSGNISYGEWIHWTATWDGNRIILYKNGSKVDSTTANDLDNSGNSDSIGSRAYSTDSYFKGNISDVRVYDHALTPSEIRELYELGGKASAPEDGVSRYELNGDVADSWGSNTATINGDPQFVESERGQALSFDGDDYVEIESSQGPGDQGAVAMWCKPYSYTSNDYNYFFSHPDYSNNNRVYLNLNDNTDQEFTLGLGDSFPINTGKKIEMGVYQHLCVSWDSSNYYAYHNGKLVDSGTHSGSIDMSAVNWYINSLDGTQQFTQSDMDDIRIYDRALKDWEVKAIYRGYSDLANPPGKEDSGAVTRYSFDEANSPQTFNYTGSKETVDVSADSNLTIEMIGAAGGKDSRFSDTSSGSGGYLKFELDVSSMNQLQLWVGETGGSGSYATGGWGRFNGGDITGNISGAAAGGGSTHIADSNGNDIAVADAGGGYEGYYDNGGGGGARGGVGGEWGEDGGGTGFGGDSPDDTGEPGGQELITGTLIEEQTGGGATEGNHGQIKFLGKQSDEWGNNDGTINGATTTGDSIRGKAMKFNGSSDYIDTSYSANFGSQAFTVSGWAKFNSAGNYETLAGTYDGTTGWILRKDNNDRYQLWIDGNNISGGTVPIGSWVHMTGVRKSDGTARVYANGELVASGDLSGNADSSSSLNLGRYPNGSNYVDGKLDDIRIYNRPLEAYEVQQLYQWGTRGIDMRRLTVNKRAPVIDTTPPTTSFSNPSDGETISGTVSVSGNANDSESSIAGMELEIDSSTLTTSNNDTISYDLDTTNYSNGTHNLTITGEDSAGNTGSTSISTTIDNGFIESFEDQSLSEYSGDTGEFSISGTSYDGSYSLHSGQTDGVSIVNTNKSFNDTTTITHWARSSDIYPNMHMLIYAQSSHSGNPNTGYSGYSYGWNSEEFSIYRYDNGSQTILYNSGEILNTGQWYKYVCERNGDTFNLRVEDTNGNVVDSTTVTESTYTSGYYGFTTHSFSPDEPIYWDYIRIQ
jgi:hypothetical protein